METVYGVKDSDFAVCAPFDAHLCGEVNEVNFAVENFHVCRKLIYTFKNGKILCGESVSACAEEVKSLTVAEEDCLLRLVNYKLRTIVKVLDGVLPNEDIVTAFVFDCTCKTLILDFLLAYLLLNVDNSFTEGASVFFSVFVCRKFAGARGTGKLN